MYIFNVIIDFFFLREKKGEGERNMDQLPPHTSQPGLNSPPGLVHLTGNPARDTQPTESRDEIIL